MSGASHAIFSTMPLVGRERELSLLRAQLNAALTGQGSVTLIDGEAGIGKTALAEALLAEATVRGMLALIGRCYDLSETPPYGPWVEISQRIRTDASFAPAPSLPSFDAAPSQAEFFERVRDFLAAVTADRPVLLLLEDLHWADAASLDLLRYLARSLASMPILLIATYRANELHRYHPLHLLIPLLVREAPVRRLDLRPLDLAAAHALVVKRYDLANDEAARLADYLVRRTEGNALFMVELLRTLEEERLLRRDDGHWTIGTLARAPVPLLLKQLIDGRVARLGDEATALLALAAVIGQQVPLTAWGTVTGVGEETLMALAERAEETHLMTAWGNGEGTSFTHALIREVLYESVPALRRRRLHRQVGEALAAQPPGDTPAPDPDTVAYHFQRAGDARAITWLIRAAERAENAFARRTAAERYEAALELLVERRVDAEKPGWLYLRAAILRRFENSDFALVHVQQALQLAVEDNDRRLAAFARIIHSYTLVSHGTFGEALREARTATDVLEALPPPDEEQRAREAPFAAYLHGGAVVAWLALAGRFTEARIQGERLLGDALHAPVTRDDATQSAAVWAALAFAYLMQGELARARHADEVARAAYDIADRHRLVIPPIRAAYIRDVLACVADDPQERERIIDDAERTTRWGMGVQPGARVDYAHYLRLPVLVLEGYWQEAIDLAEQLNSDYKSYSVTFPRNLTLGMIGRARGETEQAWQFVREALPDGAAAEPGELHFWYALSMQRLAIELALDDGDLDTARGWLEAHERWLAWSETVLGQAGAQVMWARYFALAGGAIRAKTYAHAAIAQAETLHQPLAALAAHRLLGELYTTGGQLDYAQMHLDRALALATACRAPYERALTLVACAVLAAALNDATGTTSALDEARTICTQLDARPVLARVAMLDVGVRAEVNRATREGATSTFPGGLSAREIEVLRLVATGFTNAQVAEQLFISARTVNGHLTTIYAKLGVEGRAFAIRIALEHGLC